MLRVLLVSFLLSAPAASQDAPEAAEQIILLSAARLLVLPETVFGTRPDTMRMPAELTFGLESDRLTLSDPFGVGGSGGFTAQTVGIGMRLDTQAWYIEFSGQLLDRSVRQRRIVTTMDHQFVKIGRVGLGLQLNYWELGFRERSVVIDSVELVTLRHGRAAMGGPVLRFSGPRHSRISCSFTAGWYTNRYDSIVESGVTIVSEPVVADVAPIGMARLELRTAPIAHRVQITGSVRYIRTWGQTSSWTPEDEWSGGASVDIRVLGLKRKSLLVGAVVRFGPRGPGLVSDKTFGLRGTWKVR